MLKKNVDQRLERFVWGRFDRQTWGVGTFWPHLFGHTPIYH